MLSSQAFLSICTHICKNDTLFACSEGDDDAPFSLCSVTCVKQQHSTYRIIIIITVAGGIPQSMCHCAGARWRRQKNPTREASQIQFEEKLKRRVGNCMNSRNSKLIVKAHKNFNFMVFGGSFRLWGILLFNSMLPVDDAVGVLGFNEIDFQV